ncbi:MAG: chromosomal protein MC1 [Candidatus Aenigmarchaeota archaeon]|nr:chromosomal protein MC1 [Candidatus Aenigmarchaeota archaeon]
MAKKSRGSERKYYKLLKGNKEMAVFTGRQPRQAALKAATRGNTEIRLRERGRRNRDGTYTIHVFKGSRKRVTLPEASRVSWLPTQVWKPVVRKTGIERVESLRRR